MRAVGNGDEAQRYFTDSLNIARRLAEAEPNRADYQRDLSISYNQLGMLALEQGNNDEAARLLEEDLRIAVLLFDGEPGRADLAVDVAISLRLTGILRDDPSRLQQALALLDELDRQGRLQPSQQGIRTDLQDRLR